jgi:hypothetical protein
MKRLEANMRKKCETAKISLRIEMVQSALETAKLKSREKLIDADAKLQKAMEDLSESTNITSILNNMVSYFNDKKDAEAELELAKELEVYLNEEVDIDPEDDNSK